MKTLNTYITEKLVLNKDTFKELEYNPDSLSDEYIILYSTEDQDENDEDYFDDFMSNIDELDKEYDSYIVLYKSLSDIKNNKKDQNTNNIINYYIYLDKIIDKYINGKNYGYEVRLAYGHIEIDCINSGSRGTYYIYALHPDISDKVEEWFDGYDYVKIFDILLKKGNIEKIEFK